MKQEVNGIVTYERMAKEVDTLVVNKHPEDLNSEYISSDDMVITTDGFIHHTNVGRSCYIIHRATYVLCGRVHSCGTGVKLYLYVLTEVREDKWAQIRESIKAMKDTYKEESDS